MSLSPCKTLTTVVGLAFLFMWAAIHVQITTGPVLA